MMTHDPSEYIRGLQQVLVSDKKKIAFLFGAGTSLARKNNDSLIVPGIDAMTNKTEDELSKISEYKIAIKQIKEEIKSKGLNYNIEALLSNLEQKREIIGGGTLNGLSSAQLDSLILDVKKQIREIVSIHEKILETDGLNNLIHVDFAEWICRADRKYPIEIFTTNYDYLFELGLEEKNIPYYDGFTGSHQPFFYSDSVDDLCFLPKQTKLWKIHGSLGWHFDEKSKKVWRKDSDSDDFLIYPSTLKYDDSKKQPYTALMDRLNNYLKEPDTILITCGYAFGDQHINERIFTALKTNTTAHVIALYYDVIWKEEKKHGYALTANSNLTTFAKDNRKLSIFGSRNAVIGGHYGKWKLKREPDKEDTININLYFDEDAPVGKDDPKKEEKKGEEEWTGEGELILPEFSKFIIFLQSMFFDNELI